MTLETIQLVATIGTVIGMIFVIYAKFRDPDIKADKSIALMEKQLEYERSITDKTLQTQQNCLHSLEKEVSGHRSELNELGKQISNLATIIDERIPKKL